MRSNVVLSVSFLVTFVVGLVIPSYNVEARNLAIRERLADDAAYSIVFRRAPKTSNAKKARNAVAAQAKADKKASFQTTVARICRTVARFNLFDSQLIDVYVRVSNIWILIASHTYTAG